jgi:hypothetical protein
MPTKAQKAQGMTFGKFLLGGIALILVFAFVMGGGIQWTLNTYGPEGLRTPVGELAPDAKPVDLSMYVYNMLSETNAGSIIVRVLDANMKWVETTTAASGIVTFTHKFWEGEHLWIQASIGSPGTSGYAIYTTPLTEVTVPKGDVNGDAQLDSMGVWVTSTSVATFTLEDQDGHSILTGDVNNAVNTTDTELNMLISITADCTYGTPTDFTDQATMRHYLAGVWIVVTSAVPQATITNYVSHFYSSALHYYILKIPMIVRNADLGYQTGRTVTIGDNVRAFDAGAMTFDIYDTCWANSISDITESSFLNGDSDLNPAALSSTVA